MLDFLIGGKSINKQRRLADRFADEYYDSGKLNPKRDFYNDLAEEGIADDPIRSQLVKQIFASTQIPMSQQTGQGSSLAALQFMDANKASALADAEGKLGIQEEQAKLQGRQGLAEVESEMRTMEQTRLAAKQQNRLQAESEANSRKMKLLGSAIGLGTTILGAPAGEVGNSLLGGILGFGGGKEKGFVTGDKLDKSLKNELINTGYSTGWY